MKNPIFTAWLFPKRVIDATREPFHDPYIEADKEAKEATVQ